MATNPVLSFTIIHVGEFAIRRLSELSIPYKAIADAIHHCRVVRANCTGNDVRSAKGLLSWIQLIRSMRDELRQDFRAENFDGLELTVRRDEAFAVLMSQGTSRTGRADKNPRTKKHRGPKTVEAVNPNQRQLQLPFTEGLAQLPKPPVIKRVTWILLVYWDRWSNEVRCELSLPRNVAEGAFISDWSERIILPSFTDQPQPELLTIPEAPPIDVPVQRRAS